MANITRSFNLYIDAIAGSSATEKKSWTFGFAQTPDQIGMEKHPQDFVALSEDRKAMFREAIAQYAAVCNLTFTEVPATAQPDLLMAYDLSGTWSGLTSGGDFGSNIFFNTGDLIPRPGTFGFHNYLHEIGHAMGLRHPADVAAGVKGMIPADHRGMNYSTLYSSTSVVGGDTYPGQILQYLGIDDVRAIQYRYGANYTTNNANTVYTWDETTGAQYVREGNGDAIKQNTPATAVTFTIVWDGGGIDTYDLSNFSKSQKIDLRPGKWSTISPDLLPVPWDPVKAIVPGNVGNAYLAYDADTGLADPRSLIENVNAGSGNDTVIGNQADNQLNGNNGNDALYGLSGNDTLNGGAGDDTLDGGEGNDTLIGGEGNDTYYLDATNDLIIETSTGGVDTIISSFAQSLRNPAYANVENLTLTGTQILVEGNDLNNVLTGNAQNNLLKGYAGDDRLNGAEGDDSLEGGEGNDTLDGGAGADLLRGGVGDDVYLFGFGSGYDTIIQGDGGADRIMLAADVAPWDIVWTRDGDNMVGALRGGADQITIRDWYKSSANTLTIVRSDGSPLPMPIMQYGTSGADTITGTPQNDRLLGLAGDDKLTGGAGDDILDGGAGADTLAGGIGDDVYFVDNPGDVILENAGEGVDTVIASIDYTLTGANIENLTLTGTSALNANGNANANIITGNDSANIIDGLGGADTLRGGKGDDTYYVDNLQDVIVENANEGKDLVIASVSGFTLAANVENIALSPQLTTSGSVANGNEDANSVKGNDYANTLNGNGGNDTLEGGDGKDTLFGGLGADLLLGGAGDDSLQGGDGDDTLDGGPGNDFMGGNGGVNTYYFGKGDGIDTISSWGATADKLIFKSNITLQDITWSRATPTTTDLTINISDGSKIIWWSWFSGRPVTICLSDGTILKPFITINGTSGDDALNGTSSWDTLDGGAGADTMTGGDGNDVYYVDDANDSVVEALNAGMDTVISSIQAFTLPANVENLELTGKAINGVGNELSNKITGDELANLLTGLAGKDTLDGGAGADTLVGGVDDDLYIIDDVKDVVREDFDAGVDSIIANQVNYSLAAVPNVENLTLIGNQINLTGNSLENRLTGNDANNIIDGRYGEDIMIGGKGDDTYYVDNTDDSVLENANEGYDTVISSVDYTIEDTQAEKIVLIGDAVYARGNALANLLLGNDKDNILDGAVGADTMVGGKGNDLYYIGDQSDVIQEDADGGVDTVAVWINNYKLSANVENLILVEDIAFEDGPNLAINGYGNSLNNDMTGNSHDNVLYGYEGADTLDGAYGVDSLYGGVGDDVYIVDNAGDLVVENAGEGVDSIQTTLSNYTLGANVENLTYLENAGFNGVGNAADNIIIGGDGADTLSGGGGADTLIGGVSADLLSGDEGDDALNGNAGNDTIYGGAGKDTLQGGVGDDSLLGGVGDDTYYIDQIGDLAIEQRGEGTDLVISGLAEHTLADNIENLTLAATVAIKGFGNALGNVITGNSFANQLYGLGGDDSLIGGDGNDLLDGGEGYDTLTGGAGVDTLYGGAGDDSLVGGAGNDVIYGGLGADSYVFNRGDGADVIYDDFGALAPQDAGQDVLCFGAGITLAQISLAISGSDLVVSVSDPNAITSTDKITLKNWFSTFNRVETFKFADGATLSQRDIVERLPTANNDVFTWLDTPVTLSLGAGNDNVSTGDFNDKIDGGEGNDVLKGGAVNDTLIGGLGADTLYGGLGDDLYIFNRGDGADVIYDDYGALSARGAGADILSFGAGITAAQLILALSGADLVISVKDPNSTGTPTDKITIKNWTDAQKRIETLTFGDGTTLSARQIMERLPTTANDALTWTETAINWSGDAGADKLTSGAFNDTLAGGAGNDTLDGGAGYDVAIFSGVKSDYTITKQTNGSYTILDKTSGRDGTDTLTNIEALRFSDGLYNIADLALVANTTPTILSPANVSVTENLSISTSVCQVAGFDPDPGAVLTYAISGGVDKAAFTIDPSTGLIKFVASPDYERPADVGANNVYDIVVTVSDGTRSTSQNLSIIVGNVLESAPLITSPGAISVNENVAPSSAIYKVSGSDLEGAALTYALSGGADKGLFTIDATTGDVRFLSAPDYENPADANRDRIYEIEVAVSNGVFTTKKTVAITLIDLDEAPAIISSTTVSVAENVSPSSTVYKVAGVDPEGRSLAYAISGGPDKDLFAIDAGNGNVSFKKAPDFEARADADANNIYQIEVQASDGALVTKQLVSITVTDVNEAPSITSPTKVFLNANDVVVSTTVYTVTGRDPDAGATLTYAISGGDDSALFDINASTGVVTFKTAPDFNAPQDSGKDNVYDLRVRISDGRIVADQYVAITLTNSVPSPPAITSPKSVSITENVANTAPVYKVIGMDADPGAVLTYSIAGGLDKAKFMIDQKTGEVKFLSSPDFENPVDHGGDNVYDIIVGVTDGQLYEQQAITIIVTDANDNAPVITSPTTAQVSENISIMTPVYRVTSTDVDRVGAPTYSIIGGPDKDHFVINPTTGDLTFTSAPDYERPDDYGADHVYNLRINVSDGLQNSSKDIAITVNDAIEKKALKSDFNGDGKSDILLQHSDGSCFIWSMDGKSFIDAGYIDWWAGPDWRAIGAGDLNGDGRSDILLQSKTSGLCFVWEMAGRDIIDYGEVGWGGFPDWVAKSVADFNGDGYGDVLLQNRLDGSCFVWEMNGKKLVDYGQIGWTPGADWQVKGTGDFNGDGKSDILFQNVANGSCYIWAMNGKAIIDYGVVDDRYPGAGLQARGVGDFNGDGKSDILLQNADDGACYIWNLNGRKVIGEGKIGWAPGPEWQVKSTGDYNGDGKSDVMFQFTRDGACFVWEMNDKAITDYGYTGWIPGADWLLKP